MPKNPKKVLRWMTLLCIVIGLAAIAVVAVAKEEYIIAVAMLLVAIWQILNYIQWKKSLR